MSARSSRASSPEFPILEANGLYAAKTRGDGNCLFNALSDQLYGNQDAHNMLRLSTIEHMKKHASFYRQYIVMDTTRRNPTRTTRSSARAQVDDRVYTDKDLQKHFEEHIGKMKKPGEWADSLEVSAFAAAHNVHIRLYHNLYTYTISPNEELHPQKSDAADLRKTVHLAYHTWEHYSSVRKIDGPHTGIPNVDEEPKQETLYKRESPSTSSEDDEDSEEEISRARKRRSPLPIIHSDTTTPEPTESSSDESNGPAMSQNHLEPPEPEPAEKPKLTLKLRGLKTTEPGQPVEAAGPLTVIISPKVTPPPP